MTDTSPRSSRGTGRVPGLVLNATELELIKDARRRAWVGSGDGGNQRDQPPDPPPRGSSGSTSTEEYEPVVVGREHRQRPRYPDPPQQLRTGGSGGRAESESANLC